MTSFAETILFGREGRRGKKKTGKKRKKNKKAQTKKAPKKKKHRLAAKPCRRLLVGFLLWVVAFRSRLVTGAAGDGGK